VTPVTLCKAKGCVTSVECGGTLVRASDSQSRESGLKIYGTVSNFGQVRSFCCSDSLGHINKYHAINTDVEIIVVQLLQHG